MGMMLGALFAKGASRESLQAKVYGGASMFERGGDIGMRNVGFAIDFLEREGISIYGGCVGGTVARRIHFVPSSATVTIKTSPNFAANGPSQNTASAIRGYAA
jgi:chemotaxis protein CheD